MENAAVVDRGGKPNDEEAGNNILATGIDTDRSENAGNCNRDGTIAEDEDATNDATIDKEDADADAEDVANQTTNTILGSAGKIYRRG